MPGDLSRLGDPPQRGFTTYFLLSDTAPNPACQAEVVRRKAGEAAVRPEGGGEWD